MQFVCIFWRWFWTLSATDNTATEASAWERENRCIVCILRLPKVIENAEMSAKCRLPINIQLIRFIVQCAHITICTLYTRGMFYTYTSGIYASASDVTVLRNNICIAERFDFQKNMISVKCSGTKSIPSQVPEVRVHCRIIFWKYFGNWWNSLNGYFGALDLLSASNWQTNELSKHVDKLLYSVAIIWKRLLWTHHVEWGVRGGKLMKQWTMQIEMLAILLLRPNKNKKKQNDNNKKKMKNVVRSAEQAVWVSVEF